MSTISYQPAPIKCYRCKDTGKIGVIEDPPDIHSKEYATWRENIPHYIPHVHYSEQKGEKKPMGFYPCPVCGGDVSK